MNRSNPTNNSQERWSQPIERNQSSSPPIRAQPQPQPQPQNDKLGKGPSQPYHQDVSESQPSQQKQRHPGYQTVNGITTQKQQRQYNDTIQKTQSAAPLKSTTADEEDLLKSMQALSTNDNDDSMTDDDSILECTAKSLKMEQVQTIFEKYESMRGGCRLQSVDEGTILVIFGHSSTAKRAWIETRNKSTIVIRVYKGPMDIIEDIPIVRKSALNNRPRPTNRVAQRLIHGSLGLKPPSSGTDRNSTTKR